MKRVCVFGAGAVGGHLAVRLAAKGVAVSVVVRGAHLAAIRARGLTLVSGGARRTVRVAASDRPAELGPQDLVISTLKATALSALAAGIGPLLGPETPVVFAINGIPWWYFAGLAEDGRTRPDLSRLDPGGALAAAVGPRRTIGGVIYSPNAVSEPGVIDNKESTSQRLVLGEPDGADSARVRAIASLLADDVLAAPVTTDIRREVWTKLLANISGATIASLIGAGLGAAMGDENLAAVGRALRFETAAVAAAWGAKPAVDPAQRVASVRPEAGHKPSMLQDLEARRPMEIDAIVRAPQAFARAAGVATPTLDVVGALLVARARAAGLYDG